MKPKFDSIARLQDRTWYMHPLSVALLLLVAIGIAFGSYATCIDVATGY